MHKEGVISKQHIFVVGYEDFNVALLKKLPISENVEFLPALTREEMQTSELVPALDLLRKAIKTIDESGVEPDAIITYWDFPSTIITAMLNARYSLPGPSLRSIFKCENKFWSRVEQRKTIVENLPMFATFDPNDEEAFQRINLVPPFWIKPVKSFRSFLSFLINDRSEFEECRKIMQQNVDNIYHPFQDLMKKCRMPELIANAEESCIAESSLSGHMVTVEGYVYDNDVISYGIVDSIREKDSSSFNRYQYPSQLPMDIQYRMMDLTRRVIEEIDLHDSCFNVEYFYNQTEDQLYLLEINPRTSQSHSDLFDKVHGYSQFQILMEIALGKRPKPMEKRGDFHLAAKFMHRVYEPGVVTKVPSEADLKRITEKYPKTKIEMLVEEGDDLEDLLFQDSYSFEVATIYLGADNEMQLMDAYNDITNNLGLEIEPKEKNVM